MPLEAELFIKSFRETFQSDEHIERYVMPHFFRSSKSLLITVVTKERLSIKEWLSGKGKPIWTEYTVKETELGQVIISYKDI